MNTPYRLPEEVQEAIRKILKNGNEAAVKREGDKYVVVEIERHVRSKTDYYK